MKNPKDAKVLIGIAGSPEQIIFFQKPNVNGYLVGKVTLQENKYL